MADTNDVARRYFELRSKYSHKVSLGYVKKEFNLPLHFIMGFNDLKDSYDLWRKSKSFEIDITHGDDGIVFTTTCMKKAAKEMSLNPKKIIDSKTQEIVGESVKYSVEYDKGILTFKADLPTEYTIKKTKIDFIYEPFYDTSTKNGAQTFFDDIQIFGLQIDFVDI